MDWGVRDAGMHNVEDVSVAVAGTGAAHVHFLPFRAVQGGTGNSKEKYLGEIAVKGTVYDHTDRDPMARIRRHGSKERWRLDGSTAAITRLA